MTARQAAALACKATQRELDTLSPRETREGWFFPYRATGSLSAGSNGVIVNKRTGACLVLGSAFPIERDLAAYDQGFQFDRCELVITGIPDLARALEAIEKLGITVVEPQFEQGVEWKIPRVLSRAELQDRAASLPWSIGDFPLYLKVEVLQDARRTGCFEFVIKG